jgi:hypothetical protein
VIQLGNFILVQNGSIILIKTYRKNTDRWSVSGSSPYLETAMSSSYAPIKLSFWSWRRIERISLTWQALHCERWPDIPLDQAVVNPGLQYIKNDWCMERYQYRYCLTFGQLIELVSRQYDGLGCYIIILQNFITGDLTKLLMNHHVIERSTICRQNIILVKAVDLNNIIMNWDETRR